MIRVSWTVAMAENMCLEASFKAWWSSSLFLHFGLGEVGGLLGKSLMEEENSISYWLLLSWSNDGQLGLSQNPLLFCFCLFGHGVVTCHPNFFMMMGTYCFVCTHCLMLPGRNFDRRLKPPLCEILLNFTKRKHPKRGREKETTGEDPTIVVSNTSA